MESTLDRVVIRSREVLEGARAHRPARYSEAQTGCPVTYAYTPAEGAAWLRAHGFEPSEILREPHFSLRDSRVQELPLPKGLVFPLDSSSAFLAGSRSASVGICA